MRQHGGQGGIGVTEGFGHFWAHLGHGQVFLEAGLVNAADTREDWQK